jgi:hypothetical protein
MKSVFSIIIVIGLITLSGCSQDKSDEMVGPPPAPRNGRVSLVNNSEISIRVAGYAHIRGSDSRQVQLYVHLLPGQIYYLHNLFEPDQGQLFPGGDKISVLYIADEPDPSNPSQPLFRETVELVIDGNFVIQVKNGGEYGISPG